MFTLPFNCHLTPLNELFHWGKGSCHRDLVTHWRHTTHVVNKAKAHPAVRPLIAYTVESVYNDQPWDF